jgi:acetyl esterase/lipase
MNKFIANLVLFTWLGCQLFPQNWETKSFSYGNSEGTTRQKIYVYYPHEEMRTGMNSCAVYIPGGGWSAHLPGWRDDIPITADMLLSSGCIVIYIDFRPILIPGAYWPTQGSDWEAAMTFIIDNNELLGINPSIISGWGSSAGGHGIHYLREKGWLRITATRAAPTDLTILPGYWPGLFGHGYSSAEYVQKAKEASPLYMVSNTPPISYTLLFHGTHDSKIPKEQSELIFQALKDNNHHVDYIEVENANHGLMPYKDGVETSLSLLEISEKEKTFITETVRKLKQSMVKSAEVTKVEKKVNRSLLLCEYCNLIFFKNHPQNIEKKIEIVEYRLYRKHRNETDYLYVSALSAAAVNAGFIDRNLNKELVDDYTYYVTCIAKISGENIESKIE